MSPGMARNEPGHDFVTGPDAVDGLAVVQDSAFFLLSALQVGFLQKNGVSWSKINVLTVLSDDFG